MGLMKWLGLDQCEKAPVELNDSNFRKEVLESEIPVVIDVWSDGCQPCRALAPTIMKLACKYDGKVKVAQLNVAAGPRSVAGLEVQGTPTVLFLKKGKVLERVVGIRGQHYFEEIIDTDLLELTPPEPAAAQGEAS
jgi:thioredoxin 1